MTATPRSCRLPAIAIALMCAGCNVNNVPPATTDGGNDSSAGDGSIDAANLDAAGDACQPCVVGSSQVGGCCVQ